jgi:hypothetical protein
MNTVCDRCQDFAIIAGQPPAALGLARGCWCRSESTFTAPHLQASGSSLVEPSDLRDLRALAARLDSAPDDDRDLDELIAVGGGFDSTMAAPVLEPRAPARAPGRARLFVLAGLGGPALVVAGLAIWAGAQPSAPETAIAQASLRAPDESERVVGAASCLAPTSPDPASTCSAANGGVTPMFVATAESTPRVASNAAEVEPPRWPPVRPRWAGRGAVQRPALPAPPDSALAPAIAETNGLVPTGDAGEPADAGAVADASAGIGSRQIEDLLGLSNRVASASTGDADLPQRPTRAQVAEAMRAVAPRVMNCGAAVDAGAGGTVAVEVTFAGASGQPTSVRVHGALAGTPEGSCVERAVQRARLPTFSDPELHVSSYGFPLR